MNNRIRYAYDHDRAFLRTLLILITICILAAIVGKAEGYGQDEPKKPAIPNTLPVGTIPPKSPATVYKPSDAQSDKLRIAQLEALNAQQAWFTAAQKLPEYQTFLLAVGAIDNLCQKTKSDNKWPVEVVCNKDANPITFAKPAASVPGAAK